MTVTATGTLQPTNQVQIGSELSGTIRTVEADFNDRVTVGQVLARLDSRELQAQLAQVRANKAAAEARLKEALAGSRPQEIQRAIEEFSLNQEEFLKKIEKTMNILKQLQMEMKLDELAKRAVQLLEKQQDVNKNIEDAAEGKPRPEEAGRAPSSRSTCP